MGSSDSGSVKVDGFPREEGDMSKRPKRKSEQAVTAGIDVQADRVVAILNGGEHFEHDGVAIDPSQVTTEPIPREDEARPCSLCESRRPIGKSYSRVYCTKAKVRYCRCSYCGHTWTQERK
jgi:hypothetical protein